MSERRYVVLQVFNRYLLKGGEEISVGRIRDLLRTIHEVRTCTFTSADWVGEGSPIRPKQALLMFYNPRSAKQLSQMIESCGPDFILLHNLYPVGSPSVYHTAIKHGVPVIQYIHNFRPFSVGSTLWAKGRICEESLRLRFFREVRLGAWQESVLKSAIMASVLKFVHASGWLKAVKGWIAVSDFMREKFVEAGVDGSSVFALPHASQVKTATHDLFSDNGYYLFLSRLVEEKGVRVLIDAWNQILTELGGSTPELLIGGDGPLKTEVVKATELNPKIKYLGFLSGQEKEGITSNCRAMLAPSTWWEPLGIVTYEAYDYKKPMFAAASGGLTETISHGRTGFLHEPGNARQLASQIIQFESMTPNERQEIGVEGRRWLEINADPEHWKSEFTGIIHQILDSSA